jgi:hypothetical protein
MDCLADLLEAYRVLFGVSRFDPTHLQRVNMDAVKRAYRRLALQTHPDRFILQSSGETRVHDERFRKVNEAYQVLTRYLARRRPSTPFRVSPRPRSNPVVPGWRLRIGEFLCYSGAVTWSQLMRVVVQQRRERESLGEIARRWGWVTETTIREVLSRRCPGERLGEALLRESLINSFQLGMLLRFQKSRQTPLGQYFVRQEVLCHSELRQYLDGLRRHNSRFDRK